MGYEAKKRAIAVVLVSFFEQSSPPDGKLPAAKALLIVLTVEQNPKKPFLPALFKKMGIRKRYTRPCP
jgi:hypothetical protein